MASTSSTRSESPVDIDFSVIRTSIQMGHKMIDQILNGIHYGSEEVRNLLREECDFIMECKVCRNLFRSFPNFVAHKRVYCMEYYEEKVGHDNLAPVPEDEETVVIQPEAPEENNQTNKSETVRPKNASVASLDIEKVINKTFDGKSKEYQFYTKVAEDLEKRKFTKVTNTVTLNPIATTSNAVKVVHAKGDKSGEITRGSSPKKQSPVKLNETLQTASPVKKKNSVMAVCADLARKKVLQEGKAQTGASSASALSLPTRVSSRSRKSSPRKSIEYLESTDTGIDKSSKSVGTEEDMEVSDWTDGNSSDDNKGTVNTGGDKEWLKFCDVKNSMCKVCKKSFSSLYDMKFHAKMKHVRSVVFACPICKVTFEWISSLKRHLRKRHHKSESYINNVKMKLMHGRKSTKDMEVDQDDSSSSSSSTNTSSPQKETKNMLSFSTGWKKCDKCGKVCWKAKSFYRHYNTCKGPTSKSNSKSATSSPVKTGKQNNGNGSQRNSTALLKLQEKLRAGVLQTNSTENAVKTKLREKVSKSESDSKSSGRDKKSAERSVESKAGTTSELFKALTKPLSTVSDESRSRHSTPDIKEIGQSKSYNLRLSHQVIDQEEKVSGTVNKDLGKVDSKEKDENEKVKEVQANNGSPAFKKLEERLVREAGLNDSQKTEKIVEAPVKPYGTRHASQIKSNLTEAMELVGVETKEATVRSRKLSSETRKEDNLAKVKEQRMHRESPEIKQLEEKLTREATVKPYGTRHATASQIKSNVSEAKEAPVIESKEITNRLRKLSSEPEKDDNSAKVKEQRVLRESPEIKQLEEKLTREAIVKPYGTRHAAQIKSNVWETKEVPVVESKESVGRVRRLSSEPEKEDNLAKVKEQKVLRESPEIKQLEEKLTREATVKPYGTRHAAQIKSNVSEAKEAPVIESKESIGRVRRLSSDKAKEDNVAKMKEQRVLRESPEIKQLEEKLTREALGQNKQTDDKESSKSVLLKQEEIKLTEKRKGLQKEVSVELKGRSEAETNVASKDLMMLESRKCSKRTSSKEAENRKERISEKLREKMASQELAAPESKTRSSRSVSRESDSKTDRIQDKTPEKMQLMTNLSPVSSPSRASFLPSSPTPSLHSNSGDSYNMKFKMTVQEMAELVESASLTKFAKERKKRARNILNTKQVKESQKTAAALAKPMKKQVKKKNIVIGNVYGTRNKKPGNETAGENICSTRFSGESSDDVGLDKTNSSPKSSAEGNVSSRDSSRERRIESKSLSREQKRLQNSAGFVEKNFYAVSSSRDSSKDSQSDADTEKRKLSRERKRLENSTGFVDKGLHYESDSSVDRERRSISKLSKNLDTSDTSVVAKERTKVEKSINKHLKKDQHATTSSESIQVKCHALTEHENVSNEINEKEKEKIDERLKQQNTFSVKKTVLYVGKDFTEKIKSIQQRRSDTSSETFNVEAPSISEMDTETKNDKSEDKSQIQQVKFSNTSIESKAEVTLPKASDVKENQTVESGKSIVDSKQSSSEIDSQNEQKDSPKHRTRLATGSIFFDSELLKLSPSKAEKKVAELNKASDANKGRLQKGGKSNELTLVKKRLSLSPKKESVETVSLHQRTKSGRQRYSLSTGVKQCKKCNKTFWKKKTYVCHLINSRCSDKTLSRLDRKRALSLSPDGNVLEESNFGSGKGSNKKAKREMKTSENTTEKELLEEEVNDDITTKTPEGSDAQIVARKQTGSSVQTSENIEASNIELIKQMKTGEIVPVEGSGNDRNLRPSVGQSIEQMEESEVMIEEDRSLRKSGLEDRTSIANMSKNNIEHGDLKKNQTITDLTVKAVSTCEENVKSEIEENTMEDKGTSKLHKDAIVKQKSSISESEISKNSVESTSEMDNIKSKSSENVSEGTRKNPQVTSSVLVNSKYDIEESFKSQINRPESVDIVKESGPNSDLPNAQKVPARIDEVICKNEQVWNNFSSEPVTMVTDEIPGPSTSVSSMFSEESEDNESDFSGFSEDDLKSGGQELSQLDVGEHDDVEDDLEDIDCDLGDLSDDPCSEEETDLDLKLNTQSDSSSQRPIRKSAQNRFAHVEEIWVYKEPGKPACMVEKTKSVKNRVYVIDVKNPSKLQCHNSKDVDRLIDEKGLKCRQCETPCTSISNLRRHVIRHLGWKRYKCKHCPYTCYDMSYCRQHVLRAHNKDLTNKNFNIFIIDLKKEATKKRAAKRTSTLHKSKQNSLDEDTYKKPKTSGTNSAAGQKLNTDQSKMNAPSISVQKSNTGQGSNSKTSSLKESRKASEVNVKSGIESNKVVAGDFFAKSEGIKISDIKKETTESEKPINTEQSPLDRARLNLAKALCEK